MFREIRTSEKIEAIKKEEKKYGYMNIKPKKELSKEELMAFWRQEFINAHNEALKAMN